VRGNKMAEMSLGTIGNTGAVKRQMAEVILLKLKEIGRQT
jgi:hypothetical protein